MTGFAAYLAAYLAKGLPLDADSLATIQQTLGEADPARALALLAADPEACEHAPLVALVFSPGARTRRELEPVLAVADMLARAGLSGVCRLDFRGPNTGIIAGQKGGA